MKRYFGIIVAIIGVVAIIVWAVRRFDRQGIEAAREKNELRIKAEYLERVAWLRNVPDERAYRNEIATFLGWYFKEVNEHMSRYGGNRAFDDYLQELEGRSKKTPASKFEEPTRDRTPEKRAAYEYTKAVFDLFRNRAYAPYWTGTSQGVRLDIVTADTIRVGSEEKIHLPVVVWGLPRDERVDDHNAKRVSSNATFRFTWKLYDEKDKLIGEMPGEGGPESRVDWPERFIKFFPPVVLLGHYDIDKLPQEVKTAEIDFSITGRSPSGGDLSASYSWKLDVPAAWKLSSGETWKGAQESIRPQEEIDRKKPEAASRAGRGP